MWSLVDFSALAGLIEVLDPIESGLAAHELGDMLRLPLFVENLCVSVTAEFRLITVEQVGDISLDRKVLRQRSLLRRHIPQVLVHVELSEAGLRSFARHHRLHGRRLLDRCLAPNGLVCGKVNVSAFLDSWQGQCRDFIADVKLLAAGIGLKQDVSLGALGNRAFLNLL